MEPEKKAELGKESGEESDPQTEPEKKAELGKESGEESEPGTGPEEEDESETDQRWNSDYTVDPCGRIKAGVGTIGELRAKGLAHWGSFGPDVVQLEYDFWPAFKL
jgi:hypothetical protein